MKGLVRLLSIVSIFLFFKFPVYAKDGNAIQIGNLGQILWSIVATIQFYSLPVMAIAIAGIGLAMVFSGDDTAKKESLKDWIIKIVIGGILVFSASSLAKVIQSNFIIVS